MSKEEYKVDARIWKRESTQEWVLELSGAINDQSFICRHTEPISVAPEDVAGLPSHYNIIQAAANKATEEGELPALPEMNQIAVANEWTKVRAIGYDEEAMRAYAHQAIAADRASRQVANKAEAEQPFAFVVRKPEDGHVFGIYTDFKEARSVSNVWGGVIVPLWASAAPPATTGGANATPTGASTAPRPTDDELWDATLRDRDAYHDWADKLADAIAKHFGVDIGERSNQNLPWSEALEAIENADPVGASTVLTDERIAAGARFMSNQQAEACGIDREDNWKVYGNQIIEEFREACAVAFGTPVAAQAGQVAVPEDAADAKRYRWFKENYLKYGNSDPDIRRPIVLFEGRWYGGHFDNIDDLVAAIDEAMLGPSPAKESK